MRNGQKPRREPAIEDSAPISLPVASSAEASSADASSAEASSAEASSADASADADAMQLSLDSLDEASADGADVLVHISAAALAGNEDLDGREDPQTDEAGEPEGAAAVLEAGVRVEPAEDTQATGVAVPTEVGDMAGEAEIVEYTGPYDQAEAPDFVYVEPVDDEDSDEDSEAAAEEAQAAQTPAAPEPVPEPAPEPAPAAKDVQHVNGPLARRVSALEAAEAIVDRPLKQPDAEADAPQETAEAAAASPLDTDDESEAEAEVVDLSPGEPPARPMPYEPAPLPLDDPSLQIRLARIHLKTGSLTLARAELETLAGRRQLDTEAHLDLAEARWRTGDLAGAGEAASAYLSSGGQAALGFLIAAEAAASSSQHAEARRLVEQAQERQLSEVEPIFAGIKPRAMWSSKSWAAALAPVPSAPEAAARVAAARSAVPPELAFPEEPAAAPIEFFVQPVETEAVAVVEPAVESEAVAEVEPAVEPEPVAEVEPEAQSVEPEAQSVEPEAVAEVEPAVEPEPEAVAEVEPEPVAAAAGAPIAAEASTETAAGRAFLEAGDPMMAALHFAVAIRISPESANTILEVIGDRQELPLQLVRGDALRVLGQEADAGRAYQSVASALVAPKPPENSQPLEPEPKAEPEVVEEAPPAAHSDEPEAPVEPEPRRKPSLEDLPPLRWD
jgi:hypothetical protein